LYEESEDDGTRTRNHRRDKPKVDSRKRCDFLQITSADDSGRTAGRTRQHSEGGTTDAELAALVAAWPNLPEHIRAAIRALVQTVASV